MEMMNYPTKRNITIKDIPITETMNKAYEYNRDSIEEYASIFSGEKHSQENYTDFKIWCGTQGIKYENITKKSFDFKFNKYIEKYEIKKIECDYIEEGLRIRQKYIKGLLLKN
jgi:esterase/lipase superfamily enzyme